MMKEISRIIRKIMYNTDYQKWNTKIKAGKQDREDRNTVEVYHPKQLIEIAIEQLKVFLHTLFRIQSRSCIIGEKWKRYIRDAILKMQHIHRQTVQKGQHFLRQ